VGGRFAKKNPNTSIIHNYSYFDQSVTNAATKKYDLIYSGSINKERGIEFIVEAMHECKKRGTDVSLLIVGKFETKDHEESVKKKIADYNLGSQFHFPGHVAFDDVDVYYSQSKIGMCLLPPNRTYKIALHVKLFEYLHFGLPIIVSNFGHMKEIVEEDNVGFAVDPYNANEIADKILYLLEHNRYQTYSRKCTEVAEAKYVWKNEVPKLLDIYSNLLK
jgi:glycosyltransferase involved in cell wall biosynthesis